MIYSPCLVLILHFEPSLDALSLPSDVISSMTILSSLVVPRGCEKDLALSHAYIALQLEQVGGAELEHLVGWVR